MATKASANNLPEDEVSNQWNWVNVSHPRDLNHAANISTIRRRAMLAVHRNKRRTKVEKIPPTQKHHAIVISKRATSVEREIEEDSNQEVSLYTSSSGSRTPHCVLEVPNTIDMGICYAADLDYPNQQYLLNYWSSAMASHLIPVGTIHNPMSSVWVYHALGDPLLMCTLLLHAAAHLDAVNHRPPSRLTLHYEMEVTRRMNSRLDSKDLYLQDTSIAAVVMILANQLVTSNLVEMQIHLNALERMVQMRGGLQELGMDGALQMTIKWVDITTAMFQNARPRFAHAASPTRLADLITSDRSNASVSSDLQEFSRVEITTALFRLRQEIIILTEMQSRLMACPDRTTTAEAMEFASRRTSIEHLLLFTRQGLASMHRTDQDARLRESCCIAGSIYVSYVFHGLQPRATMVLKTLKRRLMSCVESLELENHGKSNQLPASIAAIFWALCIGGTMAVDLEERTWFVLRLSRVAKQLGLMCWEQVLPILNCFLWDEKMETKAWKDIWADVQEWIVTN